MMISGAMSLALTSRNTGGGAAPAVLQEVNFSTHCRPHGNKNTVNKQLMSRTAHTAGSAADRIKVAVGNCFLTNSAANEQGLGGTADYQAWVEWPAGNYVQIPFSGSTALKTVADGDIVFSDFSATGLGISTNDVFWIWIYTTSATGILYNAFRNTARGEVTQVGVSGVATAPSGSPTSSGSFSHSPFLVIAESALHTACLIGDSKTFGQGDLPESATAAGPGNFGVLARGIAAGQPFFNEATSGLRAGGGSNDWTTVCVARKKTLPYFTHYFIGLGYNDLCVDSQTAATTQTRIEVITANILAANPNAKISIITLGPKSTSTSGGWISSGDQTAQANVQRLAYNAIVRAGTIAGNNNGYIEIGNDVDEGPGVGKWLIDPVRGRNITDAAITNASTNLTSATAAFTSADINMGVSIAGAGAAGAVRNAYIVSVTNSTTAVISLAAGTTVAAAAATIGTYTLDGLHEVPYAYILHGTNNAATIAAKIAA